MACIGAMDSDCGNTKNIRLKISPDSVFSKKSFAKNKNRRIFASSKQNNICVDKMIVR